jgi:hypothetical protein
MASFLDLAVFSINDGRSRLRDGLRALIPFAGLGPIRLELLDEIFFSALADQLLSVIRRTLVLELNVARLRGMLGAETPERDSQSSLKSCEIRTFETLSYENIRHCRSTLNVVSLNGFREPSNLRDGSATTGRSSARS